MTYEQSKQGRRAQSNLVWVKNGSLVWPSEVMVSQRFPDPFKGINTNHGHSSIQTRARVTHASIIISIIKEQSAGCMASAWSDGCHPPSQNRLWINVNCIVRLNCWVHMVWTRHLLGLPSPGIITSRPSLSMWHPAMGALKVHDVPQCAICQFIYWLHMHRGWLLVIRILGTKAIP